MDLHHYLNKLNYALEDLMGIGDAKLGLDIESQSAILVKLSGSPSLPKLSAVDIEAFPDGTLNDEHILNSSKLSETIKKLMQETTTRQHAAANIAAPGSLVISKKIPCKEGLNPTEMEAYAWLEARKAFPGLADNLFLDYMPTSENKLLLVAARKKEMQDRLNAILAGGLKVNTIDVDYYALARAFSLVKQQIGEKDRANPIGLINIETNALMLVVMQENDLIFFHRQTYNGAFLADFANKVASLSEAAKEVLDAQIKRLLQFFQTDFPGRKLAQIILSGRIAILPSLKEAVENAIHTPTQLANPLGGLLLSPSLKERMESQAATLMIGCGLALRGLR